MLTEITAIKGIGALVDACDGRQVLLSKLTLIYSGNARGKTTLSSILQSYALEEPELIRRRRTVLEDIEPEVGLSFGDDYATYQEDAWAGRKSRILVYDSNFVERNIFTGAEIATDNRRHLLQFAIGATTVGISREIEELKLLSTSQQAAVIASEGRVRRYCGAVPIKSFRDIKVSATEEQVEAADAAIVSAKSIDAIKRRQRPSRLPTPEISYQKIRDLIKVESKEIAEEAKEKVEKHLSQYNDELSAWLIAGKSFVENDDCPFCAQDLKESPLYELYAEYFSSDYISWRNELEDELRSLSSAIRSLDHAVIDMHLASTTSNLLVWEDLVKAPSEIPKSFEGGTPIQDVLTDLNRIAEGRLSQRTDPDRALRDLADVESAVQQRLDRLDVINSALESVRKEIDDKVDSLASADLNSLTQSRDRMKLSIVRFTEDVTSALDHLEIALNAHSVTRARIAEATREFNVAMSSVLSDYRDDINQILETFGVTSRIADLTHNQRGRAPRADYAIELFDSEVAHTRDADEGEIPVDVAFSEGDRRAIALAFFLAKVKRMPDLGETIIVLDDPMCSFDNDRRRAIQSSLAKILPDCAQLIVLSHDPAFLRAIRVSATRGNRPTINNNEVTLLKIVPRPAPKSVFDGLDLEHECRSEYARDYQYLVDFISGTKDNHRYAAERIRPFLEGYLKRKFAPYLSGTETLSAILRKIRREDGDPKWAGIQNRLAEYWDLNNELTAEHHDEEPEAIRTELTDAEVRRFAIQALALVAK